MNRKRLGVSAVIGVILMVAITVAIAATVYVYVSGMISGPGQETPQVQFTIDSTADTLTVSTADTGTDWDDLAIKTDSALATVQLNGEGNTVTVGTSWIGVDTTDFGASTSLGADITAGDYFTIAGAASGTTVTISMKYNATNSMIGSWKVTI